MIDRLLDAVDRSLLTKSGMVFYSGRSAFSNVADLYILGTNPGGSPEVQRDETIRRSLEAFRDGPEEWSAYTDQSWNNKPPGTYRIQPRVRHLLKKLKRSPKEVPASNVIFVRSAGEGDIKGAERRGLLELCWPLHAAVIEDLQIKVILCMGSVAGNWVRKKIGARDIVRECSERNRTGRKASWYRTEDRLRHVVMLPHPSRSNWIGQDTVDFPDLVRDALGH